MFKSLLDWFDDRTGYRDMVREALYENVPGGSRWRYVWGSTLVFTFSVQVITGLFLWMAYSPSAQSAWESVYYIQFVMQGGWLLRGIHHFTAQAMVVLLALHLWQVVLDGAYRAPREVNFWLGLILMLIVLGLSLTGYLLPWDQKGFWATQVATKIMGLAPFGEYQQRALVGGSEYGHHTLTRFFALHAGVLPGLLVMFLALHIYVFRRHGLHYKAPKKNPDGTFWPDQVLKDGIACLATLAIVLALVFYFQGAELGAPADGANPYAAARPEWYFLFLFQFLKLFPGELEAIGAIHIPGLILLLMALMPLVGRWEFGHWFNRILLATLLVGAGVLTFVAMHEDRGVDAVWLIYIPGSVLALVFLVHVLPHRPAIFYGGAAALAGVLAIGGIVLFAFVRNDRGNPAYTNGVWEAHQAAAVAHARAADGIPPAGAAAMLRSDPHAQAVATLAQQCFSCHSYLDAAGRGMRPDVQQAPNLYGFGTADWVRGILDKERIATQDYFGHANLKEGQMVDYVKNRLQLKPEEIDQIALALEAEAGRSPEGTDPAQIEAGQGLIRTHCVECHKFHEDGYEGSAPDLTGWADDQWLEAMIKNPNSEFFYGHLASDVKQPMPAYGEAGPGGEALLRPAVIQAIVGWLRGEWPAHQPPPWGGEQVEPATEDPSPEGAATSGESQR